MSEAWATLLRRIAEYPTRDMSLTLGLPSRLPNLTVTLTREDVLAFRADWAMLHGALCVLLNKEPEHLCPFDLLVAVGAIVGGDSDA